MSPACLVCNFHENNYKPGLDTDYICSRCVQILLQANTVELKRAYDKAIEMGYPNKARAIESFLQPEEIYVRETKKPKCSSIRKKSMRVVRPSRNQIRTQPTII